MAALKEIPEVTPALLDIAGAGKFLGITRWQVRGLIRDKELPVVRVRNKFYFRRATLLRWAERSEAVVRG